MKIYESAITILVGADFTTIELHDRSSSLIIARATLTPEQLSRALSRGSYTDCEIEIPNNLDLLNKKLEVSKHTFPIPESLTRYNADKDELYKLALETCPEGWTPDNYFNSQDSFFTDRAGQKHARTTTRRWTEIKTDKKGCN